MIMQQLLFIVYFKRNNVLLGFAVIIVLLSQVAIIHFLKSSNVTLTSAIKRTIKDKKIRVRNHEDEYTRSLKQNLLRIRTKFLEFSGHSLLISLGVHI